jgi:hypothetical protein
MIVVSAIGQGGQEGVTDPGSQGGSAGSNPVGDTTQTGRSLTFAAGPSALSWLCPISASNRRALRAGSWL